jgi:hypothetical protein
MDRNRAPAAKRPRVHDHRPEADLPGFRLLNSAAIVLVLAAIVAVFRFCLTPRPVLLDVAPAALARRSHL